MCFYAYEAKTDKQGEEKKTGLMSDRPSGRWMKGC